METANTRKPLPRVVTKKTDLEGLIPGDTFQMSFFYEDRMGQFVTYEGVIDGKVAVMIQDGQDMRRIVSIRISPDNMCFTEEKYKGRAEILVLKVEEGDCIHYDPSHPDYEKKKQLFQATFRWQKP
jgi:hypothetical protein